MTERVNAFEASAKALAEVRGLILRGDELQRTLERIAGDASKSSTAIRDAAGAALSPVRQAATATAEMISSASGQVERALASLEKAAADSVMKFDDRAESAVKRVVAEVASAQQRIEKSAHELASVAATDSKRIEEAAKKVSQSSRTHARRLRAVTDQLGVLAAAYEQGIAEIRQAESSVRAERDAAAKAGAELKQAVEMLRRLRAHVVLMWIVLLIAIVGVPIVVRLI